MLRSLGVPGWRVEQDRAVLPQEADGRGLEAAVRGTRGQPADEVGAPGARAPRRRHRRWVRGRCSSRPMIGAAGLPSGHALRDRPHHRRPPDPRGARGSRGGGRLGRRLLLGRRRRAGARVLGPVGRDDRHRDAHRARDASARSWSRPSRRRPWKLARETQALDHLSGGRLVLPVGLGVLDDMAFGAVGEPTEARVRAELLDESLAILDGLWSGEPFGFEGTHHRFPPMQLTPPTLQRPRIPVWVVGAWPSERSMARAARWDGLVAQPLSSAGVAPGTWTPGRLAAGRGVGPGAPSPRSCATSPTRSSSTARRPGMTRPRAPRSSRAGRMPA